MRTDRTGSTVRVACGRFLVIGSFAAMLIVVIAGIAVALIHTGPRATPPSNALGNHSYGMMGDGYGMMGGQGYGTPGTPGSGAANPPGRSTTRGSQAVTMNVKSDAEHGKLGPDRSWHDAFLPANFTVHAGATVTVTVYNYDNMPHSFTSHSLGVNQVIASGSASRPTKVTFAFTAPSRAGTYLWWCALPCDPYSMATIGFMRGYVTVRA